MGNDEIINVIKKYAKGVCENDSTGHDWWHIQRVYNNAMKINRKENANEFLITIIVLMHDLYDHKFYNGDVKEALEDTLQKLDVYNYISKENIENIIHSCINLGFSSNITDVKELSIEGKIAQDADRLDGIGAIGIARTFAYGGSIKREIYNPDMGIVDIKTKEQYEKLNRHSINHFYEKLLKLKKLMNTEEAKNIAELRHEFMQNYLNEFFDEWNALK